MVFTQKVRHASTFSLCSHDVNEILKKSLMSGKRKRREKKIENSLKIRVITDGSLVQFK